jgi:hypothetical protein
MTLGSRLRNSRIRSPAGGGHDACQRERSGFPGRLDKESSMSAPEPTTATPLDAAAPSVPALPDYAPVPRSALGPALNDHGYHVGLSSIMLADPGKEVP